MNNIPKKQNLEENIIKLAAQRQFYTEAKAIQLIQIILTIPVVITLSLISEYFLQAKPYTAIYSILILIVDIGFFEPTIKRKKEIAAQIQELFDCDVLELNWNAILVEKPGNDDLVEASKKYFLKNHDIQNLHDWYPKDIKKLNLEFGRLACQKINCWWDSKLHTKFNWVITIFSSVVILGYLFVGVSHNVNLTQTVLTVLPLLPILNLLIKQYKENSCTTKTEERLKKFVDEIWENIKTPKSKSKLYQFSRELQNEIYSYRKNNPLIPDFFYFIHRDKFESNSSEIIKHLYLISKSK